MHASVIAIGIVVFSVRCYWQLACVWTWNDDKPIPTPEKKSAHILQRVGALAAAILLAIGIRF